MTRAAITIAAAVAISACGTPSRVAGAPAISSPPVTTPVQQLHADLSAIFDTGEFGRSFWSVLVRSADSADELYSVNAAKLMMPGLVTTTS